MGLDFDLGRLTIRVATLGIDHLSPVQRLMSLLSGLMSPKLGHVRPETRLLCLNQGLAISPKRIVSPLSGLTSPTIRLAILKFGYHRLTRTLANPNFRLATPNQVLVSPDFGLPT